MEYRVIPFKKEHLEIMDVREHEKYLLEDGHDLSRLELGVNCTGVMDGRIICCGGVVPIDFKSANIWLVPSIYVNTVTKTFVKGLRKWLFDVRQDLNLDRMQSLCLNDDIHNRWMRSLGFKIDDDFELEDDMEKLLNGKDYVMYARTIWD